MKKNRFCLMLTVTNQCNLKCVYCYEGHKDVQKMSLDTAKNILLNGMERYADCELEVDFHGGEPFLNFKLIKELCEWCWAEFPMRNIRFFATTNGTLINGEIRQWLEKNSHRFAVALSLDGTLEMNLCNRGTALSDEVVRFFHRLWPEQPVKMTISRKTLHSMSDGIFFIQSFGLKANANLAYGIDWKDEDAEVYGMELKKLIDYYCDHPNVAPLSLFEKSLIPALDKEMTIKQCGTGRNMAAYDVEGNIYPCQMFIPNTLDKNKWKEISEINFTKDISLFGNDECQGCVIHNICPTCYGDNYLKRGRIGARDKKLCKLMKTEKLAACDYKIRTLLAKSPDRLTKTDYLELAASKKIIDCLQ